MVPPAVPPTTAVIGGICSDFAEMPEIEIIFILNFSKYLVPNFNCLSS